MLLSVLIPCLESRPWQTLHEELVRQIREIPHSVEVLHELDNGQLPSGLKRQRLLERATGDYVCYADDDDRVSPHYFRELVDGCLTGKDVVSFSMRVVGLFDGGRSDVETWSLGLWPDARTKGRMSVNHLCAWKRSLARRVSWCPELGYGDDQLWYGPLRASGLVEDCHVIPRVLYYYLYDVDRSANQSESRQEESKRYFGNGIPCYRVKPAAFSGGEGGDNSPTPEEKKAWEIVLGVSGIHHRDSGVIKVRDSSNRVLELPAECLERFHVVRLK